MSEAYLTGCLSIMANEKPSSVNTFSKGAVLDTSKLRTSEESYEYSLNGRIIFNDNGTVDWINAKGNKLVLTLGFNYGADTNYQIIGKTEIDNKLIIFSTQNNYNQLNRFSEIGFITENQAGNYVYKTAFNDQYDPNGELLRFNTRYNIKAQSVFENKDIVRAYWEDDHNEDRVFNIVSGQSFNYAQPYPSWYSVHSMNSMCDVQFGLIKYVQNIPGNLTTGEREYFYRLVTKDGYATPWSPGTGLIFVTTPNVNPTDWNQYYMAGSGTPTTKGHQLEIKYIDQRFYNIEVAFALYQANTIPIAASIFFQGRITGPTMTVSHVDDIGLIPIPDPTTLVQRYTDVIHSKTSVINENYLHKANVVLRANIEINTDSITLAPLLRRMLSDTELAVDKTPLTHQVPVTDSVDQSLFQGFAETYQIGGNNNPDYINYKGTQWDHLFKGYFREQTYPFAIVLFDRKGQPFFAQHIGDFTFPSQFGNQWSLQRLDGNGNPTTVTGNTGNIGDYALTNQVLAGSTYQITNNIQQGTNIVLNMQGLTVSGIDLTAYLYDANGQIQLSGFSIVRTDKIENLIAQGLIMNLTYGIVGDTSTSHLSGGGPLHSTGNQYYGNLQPGSVNGRNNNLDHGSDDSRIVFNYFSLELPDYMVNPALLNTGGILDDNSTSMQIELVGACQAAFLVDDPSGLSLPIYLHGNTGPTNQFYTKNYNTFYNINRSDQSSTNYAGSTFVVGGNYGAKYPITKLWPDIFDFTRDNYFRADKPLYDAQVELSNFQGLANTDICWAAGHQSMPIIKSDVYNNASAATPWPLPTTQLNNITYYIVNIISNDNRTLVLNPSILAGRTYHNIGHFVPINAQTIAAATQPNGTVVFNNCEVWGGDAYVDYFGYARLLPYYAIKTGHPGHPAGQQDDFGCGLIFPCETQYNHPMRSGFTYPKVGTRPQSVELFNDTVLVDGVFISADDSTYRRLEDFNVNSVLQATDEISAYFPKAINFVEEDDQPLLEIVSNIKIPGETYDQFRYFLVNNAQAADGRYGYITDLEALGHNLYVLQHYGFGRIRFNERTLESTAEANLTVGTGQGYQGHDYIATFGCQQQFAVVNNGRSFYWPDAEQGKHCRFGGNGFELLSDIHGQHSFFNTAMRPYWQIPAGVLADLNENVYDNPSGVGGILGVYDYDMDSCHIIMTSYLTMQADRVQQVTTSQDNFDFSEAGDFYHQHWSFIPRFAASYKQNFLTADPANPNKIYVHNEGLRGNFYDGWYNSELRINTNKGLGVEKVWDNVWINMNEDGAAAMFSVTGTAREGGSQLIKFNDPADNRPVYREGRLTFPIMQINQGVRLRGTYLTQDYFIVNGVGGNETLVQITSIETSFRKSFR